MDFEGINLPEGYTPSERVAQYEDAGQMAKGYDELFTKVQSKGILIPGDDASDDDRSAFQSSLKEHLGIKPPESPDAYTWKPSEGMETYFESMSDDMKRYHEAGMDDKTVASLMAEKEQGIKTAQSMMQDQQAEIAKQSEEALKEKWGDDYADNLKAVNKISERYPDLAETLKAAGLANHQTVMEALHDVAMSVREDNPPKAGGGDPKTLQARKDEIKASDAYKSSRHGQHRAAMQEIAEINKALASIKK